jgi:hypothetical protein
LDACGVDAVAASAGDSGGVVAAADGVLVGVDGAGVCAPAGCVLTSPVTTTDPVVRCVNQ